MKVIYLGEIGNLTDKNFLSVAKLTSWNPPDLEAPIWEFHFEDDISAYTDGRLLFVVEGEEEEMINAGEKGGGIKRMKRGVSIDRTLEGQ